MRLATLARERGPKAPLPEARGQRRRGRGVLSRVVLERLAPVTLERLGTFQMTFP